MKLQSVELCELRVLWNRVLWSFCAESPFSASSSSRKSSPNYYLRKRRKWPLSPYKAQWEDTFDQQKAMQMLKQSAKTTSTHLLSALIKSFNTYSCDPTPKAYHFILKTLTHNPKSDDNQITQRAMELFFRLPSFRCSPTAVSLNSLLSVLCKKQEGFEIVPQILTKSQLMNIRIEESSFFILIRALCRTGKVNYAIELLNAIISEGFSLDGKFCSLILSAMCEQKDSVGVQIMGFLEEMRKFGYCPNRVDWCNVIRHLAKKGAGMDALDVLNQMKLDGIKPDIVCYTMVLDGLFLEGQSAKAEQLFDEMLVLGLVPDIYTYNVYINGLCKQNKMEDGIKMLAWMEELGCKSDLITYNTLLAALCQSGKLRRARDVVRDMGLKGMQLNSRTYEIMIRGVISKGEIDEACGLLEEMMGKGSIPQSSTFDEIICRLCQRGLVSRAFELLKVMVGKNGAPGFRTWEALLLGSKYGPFEDIALMDLVKHIETNSFSER
ncbi:unnamed protein product [Ilex paraguariensis]|uniref:Pentatricopeptide repeat-containing protein n=1 Tax=Ilex paraguariensis TaxID=185542 RepID=A0ABC8RPI6_9AQUA